MSCLSLGHITLRASSIGSLIKEMLTEKRGLRGTVRHAFDKTVYIEANSYMFIVSAYRWRSPFIINIVDEGGGAQIVLTHYFNPFDEVTIDAEGLSNGRYTVQLSEAEEYRRLTDERVKALGGLEQRLRYLFNIVGLIASGLRDSSTVYLHRTICKHLKERTLLRREGVRSLIGLGEGFTPSGDDLYVGIVSSLVYARDYVEGYTQKASYLLRALVSELEPTISKTTWASEMYLIYSMRGLFDESIERLLLSFFTGSHEDLYESSLQVIRRGHESGLYLALGTVLGLSLLLPESDGLGIEYKVCSMLV